MLAVAISVVVTLVVMNLVAAIPGVAPIDPEWWLVGLLLPIVISGPLSWIFVRQSESIQVLNAQLTEAYAALKRTAETDHLTGVPNRAAFEARVAELNARRAGWFLVVDIDHFKAINDRHGHALGDDALIAVARAIKATISHGDVLARVGGEEFAVYTPGPHGEAALALAERIRTAVTALHCIGIDGEAVPLTVSIGVAGGVGVTVTTGMQGADRAMYRAKQEGRDRVEFLRIMG